MKKNDDARLPENRFWQKLVLTMKLTTIIYFACLMQVSASVYSQATKFAFTAENEKVSDVLREIEDNSNFRFFYQNEQVDVNRRVTVKAKDATVEQILDEIFKGEGIGYKVMEDYLILLSPEKKVFETTGKKIVATQQQRSVSGTVTDDTGQPLPGVSVVVKGTTQGTVTNADGSYSISNIPDNATLVFSFVGMRTKEVNVGSQTSINVTMAEDAIGLDEVVVVGFGTQKKADLTGAVSSVQGEELEEKSINVTNTAAALQGLSPGLTIQNFAGEPGREDIRVRIRGNGTLNNNQPLVLVDGVERSLSTVEPNDVASLTVLKDAASASIYGSRAANGVILITTKRGAVGGTTVNYSYNIGMQNILGYPEKADTKNWLELDNDAYVHAGNPPLHSQEQIDNILAGTKPFEYPWVNYESYLFNKNAVQQRHNISITSGGKNGRIFASVNYLDQDGAIVNFNNKRLSARINSDLYITDKLTATFNMNYMNKKAKGPGFTAQRLVQAMLHINRDIVGKYPDGTYDLVGGQWNAVAMSENGERLLDRDEIVNQAGLEYKILPYLTLKGDVTLKSYGQHETTFMNSLQGMRNYITGEPVTVGGWFATNSLTERQENTKEWSQRAYLNFDKKFGKHDVKGTFGYEGISNKWLYLQAYRQDFFNNDLRDISAGAANAQEGTGAHTEWGLQSFFGRVNYSYNDKYLFQANVRYDGSSRFAKGNRWGVFPSFSAGWRLSQEGFLLDNDVITNLRLRGSWGQLGNQDIGLWRYLNTYDLNQPYSFNGSVVSGAAVTTAGNPDITWETTTMTNIGFDLGFFDRLEIVAEYYWNLTTDILLSLPIAPTTGVDPPTQNAASVSNNGYEISVNYYSPQRNGGFEYSVGLNFSDVRNKIEDLAGTGPYFPDKFTVWEEGYSMTSLRGLKSPGLYKSQADFDKYPATIVPQVGIGDIIYEDLNGDGVITQSIYPDGDQYIMADEDPHYEFGINASAKYKSFDFSIFFQGALEKWHTLDGALMEGPNWGNFVAKTMAEEAWDPEKNPDGTWPIVTYGNSWNLQESDFWIQDSKYIRLKSAQLGYNIRPSKYISNIRVYLSGENLLTLTPTKLFDPETPRGRSQFFPHHKVVSAGVNITF